MSKKQKRNAAQSLVKEKPPSYRLIMVSMIPVVIFVAGLVLIMQESIPPGAPAIGKKVSGAASTGGVTSTTAATNKEIPTMPINQAVMVTVELDFGPKVPTIAEGLREIERRYTPDDGQGRTFAILDAYGEPTPEGKLHMSMHVSSEKPGLAALVFRRTGEVLWQTRITPTNSNKGTFTGKNLLILATDGADKTFTVDGSANPSSILDTNIKELGIPMRVFWPDAAEREFTFIYSACGCPVKAMVKRVGERTARTKDLPVMFPDDPAAMAVISRLMQWQP